MSDRVECRAFPDDPAGGGGSSLWRSTRLLAGRKKNCWLTPPLTHPHREGLHFICHHTFASYQRKEGTKIEGHSHLLLFKLDP